MFSLSLSYRGYLAITVALCGTLALTPVVRSLARALGTSQPATQRSLGQKKPTALLGGIAIFTAFALAASLVLPEVSGGWLVLGGSAFLFAVGLVDDLRPLRPYQKLLGQLAGALLVVLSGKLLPWTPWPPLNGALTLFWLVGITNALNLLDNMDGLAAGVAALTAASLSALFFMTGQAAAGFLLAAFAAALVGFLVYNFNPASIFMGDCGALFLGFFLASAVLLLDWEGERSPGWVAMLSVPVLLLSVPIFDTTLVTVVRKLSGRAISQGGRDHSSHRLVALGWTERGAVGVLYGLTALSGLLALWVRQVSPALSGGPLVLYVLFLMLLGIYLGRIKVYRE